MISRAGGSNPKPRFQIGWYNGWSPEERLATTPIQRAAVADGRLTRPTTCSICAASARADNPVWFHNEDYGRPLDVFDVCRTCHRVLHERFETPEPWLSLVKAHADGSRWFERLTMDPASLRLPFDDTYPNGIATDEGSASKSYPPHQEALDGTLPL